MISRIYSVFDKKVKAFMPPFACRADGEAIRVFTDACCDRQHVFCKHPEDYVLMYLCMFDDETGLYSPQPQGPAPLIEALQCVKVVEPV